MRETLPFILHRRADHREVRNPDDGNGILQAKRRE